jgi:transglutaminase-like putative cysteine protease
MIFALNVHHSRVPDLVSPDHMRTWPPTPVFAYRDHFGNWCNRLLAPAGSLSVSADTTIRDSGREDPATPPAPQHGVENLPSETLLYLLGSRYCETDRLVQTAWDLFEHTLPGWQRVQAICDFVHAHIHFGYENARATRTALEAFNERVGVCRDYAHLAISLCRCMNIPARYCTGYLGDIGVPPAAAPMDFSAWFEAYLGGQWHAFDPRNHIPRIGRVLIAQGRDAADVAISTAFGSHELRSFQIWTDEVAEPAAPVWT